MTAFPTTLNLPTLRGLKAEGGGRAPVLCVAGGKGGCGKTTTAVGLARALVGRGHRPVLVDGDVDMPDLPHRLGLEPGSDLETVADGTPVSAAARTPRMPLAAVASR